MKLLKIILKIPIMKLILFLGGVIAMTAFELAHGQDKFPNIFEEAVDSFVSPPAIAFSYNVDNKKLAGKHVEFVYQNGRYSFKWINIKTGELVKMYSYDGHRYYNFAGDGHLTVSSVPPSPSSISWFNQNPNYFIPLRILGYDESFSPASISPPRMATARDIFKNRVGDNSGFNTDHGKYTFQFNKDYVWPCNFHISVNSGMQVEATASEFISFAEIPGFSIPGKVVYSCSDKSDAESESALTTITVDKASVKLLKKPLDDDDFRIPLTIVSNVYDLDSGVTFKSQDWAQ